MHIINMQSNGAAITLSASGSGSGQIRHRISGHIRFRFPIRYISIPYITRISLRSFTRLHLHVSVYSCQFPPFVFTRSTFVCLPGLCRLNPSIKVAPVDTGIRTVTSCCAASYGLRHVQHLYNAQCPKAANRSARTSIHCSFRDASYNSYIPLPKISRYY